MVRTSATLAQTRRRRRILTWIPTGIVILVCVGFFVGAYAVSQSWWFQDDPVASDDQQTSDGQSRFTPGGVDYLTRQGTLSLRLDDDAATAQALGLASDGVEDITPRTPVRALVSAPGGELEVSPVTVLTLGTADDRLCSVEFELRGSSWTGAVENLRDLAPGWGWSEEDVSRLSDQVAAATSEDGDPIVVGLGPIEHLGAVVSARVEVTLDPARVTTFVIASCGR